MAQPRPSQQVLRVAGVHGSPYTRKLVSVLRFRRLAYRFIVRGSVDDVDLPVPPGPALLPNIVFGDDAVMSDSTPIIQRLEETHNPGERGVYPQHNGMAFLNKLLEDYADEWQTKHMFHYRWWFKPDIIKSGRLLPLYADHTLDEESYRSRESYITKRQVARVTAVTGSSEITAPIIEESYRRIMVAMDAHFAAGNRFLFGNRPSSADFAMYGQLTCLTLIDPTPMKLAEELAPRVVGYTIFLEDASGCAVMDQDWDTSVSPTLKAILCEAGRLYAPFMVANKAAVDRGDKEVRTVLDGKPYVANAFSYQAKCARWLQEDYGRLAPADRAFVDEAINGTGLEVLFATSPTARL